MATLAVFRSAAQSQVGQRSLCGALHGLRPFASGPSENGRRMLLHGVHDLPRSPQGILELREYQLQPASLKPYVQLLAEHIERRKQLSPLLGMFTCDTGGSLTSVLHLYQYRDLSHREEARAAAARDVIWQRDMVDAGRHAGIVYQASSIIQHANHAKFAGEFQFPRGTQSAAAFQDGESPSSSSGSPAEGTRDSAGAKTAQKGTYVLATHQMEPWGPHGADLMTRLAAVGQNAELLQLMFGSEIAFAGSTVLGTHQILELHRFRSTANLDACIVRLGGLSIGYQQAATLRLLMPLPFSPWQ